MPLRKLSVLVVDDCAHMRNIVICMLRGVGCRLIGEAADGVSALEQLRATHYDVLITDYAMPTLNGIELTRILRTTKDSPQPRIPILMMTAHTERARILGARDVGVHELVSKPLAARTLLERLFAIIDQPRPWVTTRTYSGPCRRRRSNVAYNGPLRREEDADLDLDNTQSWRA
jgi:CheY-like chemotaxis protein